MIEKNWTWRLTKVQDKSILLILIEFIFLVRNTCVLSNFKLKFIAFQFYQNEIIK